MALLNFKKSNIIGKSLTLLIFVMLIGFFSVPVFAGVDSDIIQVNTVLSESDLNTLDSTSEQVVDVPGNQSKLEIQAQTQTKLQLQDRIQINLTIQEQAQLQLNICDSNPVGPLPENTYQFRNFYQFELNKSTQLQATFQMQFNNSDLPEGTTPQMLTWAYYNTNTNQWEYVYSWLNQEQNMVMTNTNHFSTWTVLVSDQDNRPVDAKKEILNEVNANGTAMKLEYGNTYRFRTQMGFELNVSLNKTAELKLNETVMNQNQYQYQYLETNQKAIGKVLEIELNETGIQIQATLAYKVASSEVPAGIDPLALKFAYFNGNTNQWTVQNSWVEDIGSGYYMVYADTDHFSTWTILGTTSDSVSSSSSTSSIPGFELLSLFALVPLAFIGKKFKK